MKPFVVFFLPLLFLLPTPATISAQTYHYDGGSISAGDLRRARPYKKGTFLIQSGRNRGVIWIPKHDARGNRWLELLMEHFLQGAEIRDYSPIQVGTIVGGSHGMASVLTLMMDVEARELLGLSKEQGEQLNEEFTVFRRQVGSRMQDLRKTNPRATPLQVALARISEIERLSLTLEPRLETFLSKGQILRAKEMVFQLNGGFNTAVVDLGILSLFAPTQEQREKLELIAEDANEKRDKVFAAKAEHRLDVADYQGFDAALGEVAFVTSRKIRDVLTVEQLERGNQLMKETESLKAKLGLTNK